MSISGAYPGQALRLVEKEIDKLSRAYTKLYVENYQLDTENAKLRKAARDAWFLFVRFGAVEPYNLPEVDRVRESLKELGIEVSLQELGIEINNE